jgi:hypothetical protein
MHIGCFRSKTETKSCCSEQNNGQNGHAPTHMGVPTAVTLGLYVVGIHVTCQGWRGDKIRGSQHAYWFRSKTETKSCCSEQNNGPSGHAPTHMGVPIAVTLGLYVVGIHITCQGWRGEKVRGSQPAYWVFQKRNRAKILTFCCPVNKNVTDVFLM